MKLKQHKTAESEITLCRLLYYSIFKCPCKNASGNTNTFSPTLIVVPLTTKIKKTHLPVHVITAKNQMALCECILTISKEQIISYIKTLDEKTMKLIDRALSISLELEKEEKVLKS